MKKLIIIFLIVLSVLAYMQIKGWIAEGGPLLNVTNVVVPKGASLKTVAEELSRAGVIDKPWLFRIMARINGLAKHLKAGEYQFMPGISLQAAMDKIARGEVFFPPDNHSRRTDQRSDYVSDCQLSRFGRRD